MFWGPHDIATVTAGRTNANRSACWDLNSKNKTIPEVVFSLSTNCLGVRLPVPEAGGGAKQTGFITNSHQVFTVTVRLRPHGAGVPQCLTCILGLLCFKKKKKSRQLIKWLATFNVITKMRHFVNAGFICVLSTTL